MTTLITNLRKISFVLSDFSSYCSHLATRAWVTRRAVTFQLAVWARSALGAIVFQLPMGAWSAHYAVGFKLAVRTTEALCAVAF